ncbi:MAG: AMP-binding protein, partial [Promethearchaeota archaeon]
MSEEIPTHWYDYWPEGVPKHIKYREITLGEMLRETAEKFPDSQAIYFEGFRMTYEEFNHSVDKLATSLSKIGVKKGDVIAIDLPNCPQFVIAFYAIVRIGAIANPIIPLHKFVEIV